MTQQQNAFNADDAKLIRVHLYVGYIAVFLGAIAGLLQGLQRGGMITLPSWLEYYQLLTAHGVLLALVFTTYFIIGFLYSGMSKNMGRLYDGPRIAGWIGFYLMTIGTAMAAVMIIIQEATVLYTFYAPLQASPYFYIGLALVVVGSWISGFSMFAQYRRWKKENKGKLSPLFSFLAVATMLLWFIATLGVAVTVLFQFIPWAFGLTKTIDVLLSRTLFWYFGHPLVYFWLLPAYIAWYVIIPKIIKGKIFSDSMARMAFVLFIIFSMPVGFHHQLLEPGISPFWKYLQVVLTFMVIIPSLMTAFSIFATFETAGRRLGATGVYDWFKKLPWSDVRFFAPMMGMLFFIPGGIGGIINASHQLDQMTHNTLFVTGHFHLTIASTVILTFFGITYWLMPVVTGRKLTPFANKLGMWQTILWTAGMVLMSGAMHTVGLLGSPRRTSYTTYQDHADALSWLPYHTVMAVGGVILFIAAMLMVYIVVYLAFFAPKGEEEYPMGEVSEYAEETPRFLENWKIWIAVSATLILIAYTIPIMNILEYGPPGSPPYRFW